MKKCVVIDKNNKILGIFKDRESTVDFFKSEEEAYDLDIKDFAFYAVTFNEAEEPVTMIMSPVEFVAFMNVSILKNKDVNNFHVVYWP